MLDMFFEISKYHKFYMVNRITEFYTLVQPVNFAFVPFSLTSA